MIHLKIEAVFFRNVVFVQSVAMEKVPLHISDTSHVSQLSKNYGAQLSNFVCSIFRFYVIYLSRI
jgi:hypothetical protein